MERLMLALVLVAGSAVAVLKSPTPSDLLPFLSAAPKFPTFSPAFFPQLISNARVDYGVGLPGGRRRADPACSENKTLALWDAGVIASPKYSDDYPPSTICEWILEAPEGSRIHVTVLDIDIQPWFLNYFDAVSFSRDGQLNRVDNYAGNQNSKTPFNFTSTANRVGIRFKSDAVYNRRGFKIQYLVRPIDEGQKYLTNDDGVCGRATYKPEEVPSTTTETVTSTVAEEGNTSTTTQASSGTRIVGNRTAEPHAYPWMVAMLIDQRAFCGGSIIDNQHILTAGHCASGAEQITILLGAHDIKASSEEEPQRRVVNVTKENIFTHPKYNEDTVFNDIAIIRLPEPITFSPYMAPICLPNRAYFETYYTDEPVSVAGWGLTADRGKVSPQLQETNVTVLSNANCRIIFRDLITGNNICTKTTPTSSPCRGDSGGPLMVREEDGRLTHVGIVSFGTHTCERGFPVSFTRTTAFLDFISQVTGRGFF